MPPSKSSPAKLLAIQRAEQIVALRARGVNVSAIARQLNLSRRWVQVVLNKHLTAAAQRIEKHAAASRGLALARLDAAIRVAYLTLDNKELPHDLRLKAIDRIVALETRRAKLEGLDAPEKVAPVNPDGRTPYNGGITDEERAAKIAELLAKAQQQPPAQDQP